MLEKLYGAWRDSADNNQHKLMTLSLDEFLCRFLLHLISLFNVPSDSSGATMIPTPTSFL
jgi:hypothetical protein